MSVALPENRTGIQLLFVELDAGGQIIWLAYNDEVTGKGTRTGIPTAGILEELRPQAPTAVQITLTPASPAVTARLSLLQDQADIDSAWKRAKTEDGWSTRRRTVPTSR